MNRGNDVSLIGTNAIGQCQLTLSKAFLHINFSVKKTEITDGGFHVLTSALSLNTIKHNRCLTYTTKETINATCAVCTADTIHSKRYFEKAEPTRVRMLTHIAAELVSWHIIIVSLQRNSIQQQLIVMKKTLRSTTHKQPT